MALHIGYNNHPAMPQPFVKKIKKTQNGGNWNSWMLIISAKKQKNKE